MSAESITFIVCGVVVVAAVVGMFPLRRAADRNWRLHALIVRPWVQFKITIRDQSTPALVRMQASINEMQPAFQRFADAMNHGTCPKCGERKFIGHGPLCSDCYLGAPS